MKRIKVGVFGCNIRGQYLARDFMKNNCDIVAACEKREAVKEAFLDSVGHDCVWYEDFDAFIEHKMDAVVLANFFPEHAPYAIKCFERGIHVFSECISNGTMAEGVELIRAFEKSNSIYMLAENYPQMIFNREIQKVCAGGTLGKILYAEGEYNHPSNPYDATFRKEYIYFPEHWRNFNPKSYYITHSLGPVMRATGATPVKVNAFAAFAPVPQTAPTASHVGERTAVISTFNDDGSIFKVTGCSAYGGHHNAYRVCGTKGQIENVRGMGNKIMLRYNSWEKPEDMEEVNLYDPAWNDKDEEIIKVSGHGGADYLTVRHFVECIKEGKQPEFPFDIHSAVAMSSVAILAHRSILEGGKTYDIPDFHKEEWRKKYENDRLTPFFLSDGTKPSLPCCTTDPNYKPTEEQLAKNKELLK